MAQIPASAREISLPPGEIMAVPGTKRKRAATIHALNDDFLMLMLLFLFSG